MHPSHVRATRCTLSDGQVAVTRPENSGANRLSLLARAGELLSSPGANERTLERLATLLVTGFARLVRDRRARRGRLDPPRARRRPHDGPGDDHARAARRRGRHADRRAGRERQRLHVRAADGARPAVGRDHAAGRRPRRSASTTSTSPPSSARRAAAAIETARLVRSLARSEERYRLLFEASPLPMWVYDSQTLGLPRGQRGRGPPLRLHAPASSSAMTIKDIRPPEDVESRARQTCRPAAARARRCRAHGATA